MVELNPYHNNASCLEETTLYRQCFAGDTLNTAVYLARLCPSQRIAVEYVTAIGCDPLSNAMQTYWKKEGVGCRYVVSIQNKHPGLYIIHTNCDGERSFHYWRRDSAATYLLSTLGLTNQQYQSLFKKTKHYLSFRYFTCNSQSVRSAASDKRRDDCT